jgi:uncharacterized protein (TIGR03435 family)
MRISVALFAVIGLAVGVTAQSPSFEVASVKIHPMGDNGSSSPDLRNGTFTARNVSMRRLLRDAYELSESRITGPDWLDSDSYDVLAKAPQGVPDSELMPMLQALLKERFHLAAHREMKEMPVFEMVVAKGGLKIWPFDPARPVVKPPPPANPTGAMVASNGVVTMPQLAIRLTLSAGRPVLDKTGLNGRYGFFLLYTQLSAQSDDATAGSGPPVFSPQSNNSLGSGWNPKRNPSRF